MPEEPTDNERMDSEIWEELLKSPYDKEPRQPRSPSASTSTFMGLVAIALVVGSLVGWFLAPNAQEVVVDETTTTLASTTTGPVVVSESGFLPGYVALGDTAFAPILQFSDGDRTYVAVSEIVAAGQDREAVRPTVVGRYSLPMTEGTPEARRSITAVAAPGIRLVEFETLVVDGPLSMTLGTEPITEGNCDDCNPYLYDPSDLDIEFDGFPVEIADDSLTVDLGGNGSVHIDRMVIAEDWGIVDWHVESVSGLVAQVDVYVYFLGPDSQQTGSLVTKTMLGPRFGQSQPPAVPGPAHSGSIQLFDTGSPLGTEIPTTGIALRLSVTWTTPTGLPVSLEGGTIAID